MSDVQPWVLAAGFPEADAAVVQRWSRFVRPDRVFFPTHVGIELAELRVGYARMVLRDRAEVRQVAGLLHGGALATLIDTVAVPAIATAYPEQPDLLTVSLTVNYLGAVGGQDAVGEAWVERSTSSLAFVAARVSGATDRNVAATASLVYRVRPRT